MRRALVLLLLSALPAGMTSSSSVQRSAHVSLEVGTITVWLGMTQEDAAKRFRGAGYQVMITDNELLVHSASDSHVLEFMNGQLVFADREWYTKDKSDGLDAVLGALGALAEKVGNQPCAVIHSPLSSPDSSGNRIFVSCGDRSVMVGKGTILGQPFLDVSERIGDMPSKTE